MSKEIVACGFMVLVVIVCLWGAWCGIRQARYHASPRIGEVADARIVKERTGDINPGTSEYYYVVEWQDKDGAWHRPEGECWEVPFLLTAFKKESDAIECERRIKALR